MSFWCLLCPTIGIWVKHCLQSHAAVLKLPLCHFLIDHFRYSRKYEPVQYILFCIRLFILLTFFIVYDIDFADCPKVIIPTCKSSRSTHLQIYPRWCANETKFVICWMFILLISILIFNSVWSKAIYSLNIFFNLFKKL